MVNMRKSELDGERQTRQKKEEIEKEREKVEDNSN